MKKKIVFISLFLFSLSPYGYGQYKVEGGQGTPLLLDADAYNIRLPTMLVYALYGLNRATISYESSYTGPHQWYKYATHAFNDVEPIPCEQMGNTSFITNIQDGYGYFVGETNDPSTRYVWIIDYSQYLPSFSTLHPDNNTEDRCSMLSLQTDLETPTIVYYLPTGSSAEIVRLFTLAYNTFIWNDERFEFQTKEVVETIKATSSTILLSDPPLCDSYFTLSGDAIANHFGAGQKVTSDEYKAVRVEAHFKYDDGEKETPDNQQFVTGDMTYPAPVDFVFTAIANEPVAASYRWRIYRTDQDKSEAIVDFTSKELRHPFNRSGRYSVKLEVSDRQSVCVDSASVDVTITESFLDAPNAFSPASSPGVNDIYKVSYKSIVKFNAWIFNRWGNQLYHWSDPAGGWDGKVNGKVVPTGVYYVVIEAEGSDGQKYKIRRDVNILR